MNIFFFWKLSILSWIGSPSPAHMSYWKTILTIWQNMKERGLQKSQFPNSSELGKIWKCSPGQLIFKKSQFSSSFRIHILNLCMNWEKLLPNLSFTLKNTMGNLHKKWWLYFKLYEWDIPFPKMLRTYQ